MHRPRAMIPPVRPRRRRREENQHVGNRDEAARDGRRNAVPRPPHQLLQGPRGPAAQGLSGARPDLFLPHGRAEHGRDAGPRQQSLHLSGNRQTAVDPRIDALLPQDVLARFLFLRRDGGISEPARGDHAALQGVGDEAICAGDGRRGDGALSPARRQRRVRSHPDAGARGDGHRGAQLHGARFQAEAGP